MVDNGAGLRLPLPSTDAIAHSHRLTDCIVEKIHQAGGVISFSEYMEAVLYQPGLGYYSAGSVKFGAQGDFVTSPEISPLFGFCLAQQLNQLFDQGCASQVIEFGAGSGKMCAQIIQSSDRIERYIIIDLSADLIDRQQRYLRENLSSEQFRRIEWCARLADSFDGVVLANEVLDAMPVALLRKETQWQELGVGLVDDRFAFAPCASGGPAIESMLRIEQRFGPFAQHYSSEVNLNYAPWLASLAASCAKAVVLLIDYGYEQSQYYHPERSSGTLTCHYQHHVHDDPLIYPGLQDVTAFVDFDALADAAEENQFSLVGLVSQAEFLFANGLLEEAEKRASTAEIEQQIQISQQVKTLTLPSEMGEKFKVLALQKNIELEMPAMTRGYRPG